MTRRQAWARQYAQTCHLDKTSMQRTYLKRPI